MSLTDRGGVGITLMLDFCDFKTLRYYRPNKVINSIYIDGSINYKSGKLDFIEYKPEFKIFFQHRQYIKK